MTSLWTCLRAAADPLARRYNLYTAYTVSEDEFVAAWCDDVAAARARLRDAGYVPQYLSAAKRHPDDGALHDLSYRRVPADHPPAVVGTRLDRDWSPRQCQYHVHVFDRPDGTDVFSHYELRPDLLRPRPNLRRLREHYRPEAAETYLRCVTDLSR